jgi:hypothetical protein
MCQIVIWEPGDGRCTHCTNGTGNGRVLYEGPVCGTVQEAYEAMLESSKKHLLHSGSGNVYVDRPGHGRTLLSKLEYVRKH